MQIKRLRLTGFKSFVDPAELRIEPGLTGVVGPNGCGKSNLLEAIRWVMGESSPKSMRSGGMEDVIFAGTATRPPRNFAEVALVCDTEGAPLGMIGDPGAGHDLEVIRRIERSAGSAYRANGRDVRAKDVALIFADAATGAHSPALISQGKIAAVISARPAERRAMLEEAAGIAGLHVRRKDAEQKLRATETNLARLTELVGEMDVRANALRRQARAAEKYRRLSDEIRVAEGRMIYARWRDAAAAADVAQAESRAAETLVAAQQSAVAEAESAQQQAATHVAALRRAAQEARDARAIVAETHARLSAEAAAAARRLADSEAQQARLVAERAREDELAEAAHAALLAIEGEAKALVRTLAASEAELPGLAKAVQAAQADLHQAELALATARTRAAGEAADRRIATAAHDNSRAVVQRLTAEQDRIARDRTALGDSAALAKQLAVARKDAEASAAAVAMAEATLQAAETAREAATADLAGADSALSESRAVLAALDGEAATLVRALARKDDGAARVLDTLRAEPGYEAALAAALGDDLEAGLGEDVPRGWRGAVRSGSDPALPAGTQPLIAHVAAPPELARRLAQIAVADTDTGQPLSVGQRLVTRDGHLRRWDGFVAHGDGATAAERLVRQNRLDQIAAQRPAVELGVAQLGEKRSEFVAARDHAAAAIAAARATLATADGQRRSALRAIDAAEAACERDAQARARLDERSGDVTRQVADAVAAEAQAAATLAALPDPALAALSLGDSEGAARQAQAVLATAQSAAQAHERTRAADHEQHAVLAAEAKGWKARSGEAIRRISDMDKRAAALAKEVAALVGEPERLAAAVAATEAERSALADTVIRAEADERAGEATQGAADAALAERREALSAAREARAGAIARTENAELRRIEMGRLSGERFSCPPPILPQTAGFASDSVESPASESGRHDQLMAERERLGPVNLVAADELTALEAEAAKSVADIEELTQAVNRLRGSIGSLNREGRVRLLAAFEAVNTHFERLFTTLFNGGQAHLEMIDADDPLEAGLEIMAQPPGKRLGSLTLLSGGEQALTAVALIFALFLTNPAPICVLDEVDAPLDDANIERFCDLLDSMARETRTRYLIVTHNAVTMARMHRLFGVTMVEQGVSRLVSVDLGAAEDLLAAE